VDLLANQNLGFAPIQELQELNPELAVISETAPAQAAVRRDFRSPPDFDAGEAGEAVRLCFPWPDGTVAALQTGGLKCS
jgi:hypothetical protein